MTTYYKCGDGVREDSLCGICDPVVVIDPEDETTLSRLWRSLPANLVSIDQLQSALREFANPKPPKPECPAGLGAVVEDEAGEQWVHFDSVSGWWWRDKRGRNARWHDITAVRVLSEGVPE